jgi:putative N6-adenine-specific DNA methylase
MHTPWTLFAATAPGCEAALTTELSRLGAADLQPLAGGVQFSGDLLAAYRANLRLGSATRVLLRLGQFQAVHLSELSRRARQLPWATFLRPGQAVRVRATCRQSKIYHSGAAAERVAQALAAACGAEILTGPAADDAAPTTDALEVLVRLERNACEVSLDTSGVPLHRRGFKLETAKAPLRETLAAAFLLQCGWRDDEPLCDPLCGSGTFVLEAAARAARLAPGRGRVFALERFACATGITWPRPPPASPAPAGVFASDRDAGAIAAATRNAERAGLADRIRFACQPLAALQRPVGPSGLLICNPPYGQRVGDPRTLRNLYATLGNLLRGELAGWRLALVTSEPRLAHATGVPFAHTSAPIPHGGIKVRLYWS